MLVHVFYRNVQARWTPWRDGDSRFAISLERPGASGDGGRFSDFIDARGISGDFEVPDLAAHYRWADGFLRGPISVIWWFYGHACERQSLTTGP